MRRPFHEEVVSIRKQLSPGQSLQWAQQKPLAGRSGCPGRKSEEKETQRECGDKKAERSRLGRPCKVGTGGAGKATGVIAHCR